MRVLLARRNDHEAQVLTERLGRLGVELASLPAGDREDIVTYTDQSRFDYQAVIFDSMSLGDYVGTLEMIRDHGYTIPVVVLGLPDGSKYRTQALNCGADGYVTKHPVVDAAELVAVIKAAIHGRRLGVAQAMKILNKLPKSGDTVREPLASV